jgi:type III secretion system YscI/HrpB-like protein
MDIAATSLATTLMGSTLGPASAPLAPADPLATAQFAQMMGAQAPATEPPQPVVIDSAAVLLPAENRTMGDNILTGMESMSSEYRQAMTKVNAALDSSGDMTISDMLRLQMGLMQISVQHELVAKGISRSTQNLDQLVKIQ